MHGEAVTEQAITFSRVLRRPKFILYMRKAQNTRTRGSFSQMGRRRRRGLVQTTLYFATFYITV